MSDSYKNISNYESTFARRTKEDGTVINVADILYRVNSPEIGAINSLNYLTKLALDGNLYRASARFDVTQGSTSYLQIKAGNKDVLLVSTSITTDSDQVTFDLIEGSDITDGTTEININNVNRSSANTPELVAYTNPTVNSVGDVIEYGFLPGSTTSGSRRVGAGISTAIDWVLESATSYLRRIVNSGDGDVTVNINALFYEIPN